jgi:hypothetical protein
LIESGQLTPVQCASADNIARPTHNTLLHLALERSVRGLECEIMSQLL